MNLRDLPELEFDLLKHDETGPPVEREEEPWKDVVELEVVDDEEQSPSSSRSVLRCRRSCCCCDWSSSEWCEEEKPRTGSPKGA